MILVHWILEVKSFLPRGCQDPFEKPKKLSQRFIEFVYCHGHAYAWTKDLPQTNFIFRFNFGKYVIAKSQDIAKISTKQKRRVYTNFKKAFLQIKLLRFIISRVVEFIIVYNLTTTGAGSIDWHGLVMRDHYMLRQFNEFYIQI